MFLGTVNERRTCTCGDCGKEFYYGDEGDNDQFCLRCEHLSITRDMDDLERDDYDRLNEGD